MTILLGIACEEGLVIAADKLLRHDQSGTRQESNKIHYAKDKPFAVCHAGNAYMSMFRSMDDQLQQIYSESSIEELIERKIPDFNNKMNEVLVKQSRAVDFFGIFPVPILCLESLVGAYYDGKFRLYTQKWDETELREAHEHYVIMGYPSEKSPTIAIENSSIDQAISSARRVISEVCEDHPEDYSGMDIIRLTSDETKLAYTVAPKDIGKKTYQTPDELLDNINIIE